MTNQQLKILFITGSYPPKICGVGDYTFKLLNSLKLTNGPVFDLFYKSEWSLRFFKEYLKELKSRKPDFYHLQYPTEGYGYSFVPLLLMLFLPKRKLIITVHELSSRNMMAYIYTVLLIFFSKITIVSNDLEREHATKFFLNKKKVNVIPIASNIRPSAQALNKFDYREIDVAYFGHIRPLKGIEDFIEAVLSLPGYPKAAIIGQSMEKYAQFLEEIKVKCQNTNIQIILNKDEDEISDLLADVKIMYLPYPDGVSNRRGTLLASVQNGCAIVTRESDYQQFNSFFNKYCYLINSNQDAGVIIQKLLKTELEVKDTSELISIYSWNNVTKMHLDIYNEAGKYA